MWHINGPMAKWSSVDWQLEVDITNPAGGLQLSDLTRRSNHCARVFQMNMAAGGLEPSAMQLGSRSGSHVRGDDLIVTYPATEQAPFETQVDWRILGASDLSGGIVIDLLISRQTSLLDGDPAIRITSAPAEQDVAEQSGLEHSWFRLTADVDSGGAALIRCPVGSVAVDRLPAWSAFLLRSADTSASYVQIVQTADLQSIELGAVGRGEGAHLTATLFRERLEKGVVRRARLRGIFMPRDIDSRIGLEHCRHLQDAVPPLAV